MKNSPSMQEHIAIYFDGELPFDETDRLAGWLREDTEHLREFIRYGHFHRRMRDLLAPRDDIELAKRHEWPAMPGPADRVARRARRWEAIRSVCFQPITLSLIVAGLFTTCVLLGLALITIPEQVFPFPNAAPPSVAVVAEVTATEHATWDRSSNVNFRNTAVFSDDTLVLRSGLAEVTFDGGAKVMLEGPCQFTVRSDRGGEFTYGKLGAHVPPRAVGFSIETPFARFVDLGTSFVLEVKRKGAAELTVLDGAVECIGRRPSGEAAPSVTLGPGQVARVAGDGIAQVQPGDARRLALHHEWADRISPVAATLGIKIDVANSRSQGLPHGFKTYVAGEAAVPFESALGVAGRVGVRVESPFYRNTDHFGYGEVTALDPSENPFVGYNALVNSGALVNEADRGPIVVELSRLKAGDYAIRFYMHGTFLATGVEQGAWDISGAALASEVPATFGVNQPGGERQGVAPKSLAEIGQVLLEFSVARDGDPARFIFTPRELASNGQLWLNGFRLTAMPRQAAAQQVNNGLP